ncbi:TetR/AcrR family transcriptional regulator [Micromonospora yangpuensis]|uniref:TetR/AcrR family transcriptional regulator n=1 Tax=Micromonospora yangpuensis TaxID=683228 RepID=UPI001C312A68|nr:TetR/AcrR family transcriptional regulator [Micromonospora yangpuensis]
MSTTNAESLRADSARVRARMLQAARDRIAAGELELPLNAVAKAAGVGVGTVYRHFPSRQVLLEALAAEGLAQVVAAAVRAAAEPDVANGLAGLLRVVLEGQRTDPALAAVLATPEPAGPQTRDLVGALTAAVDRLLRRARADGVIRSDVTAGDLQALLCGLQHAVQVSGAPTGERYLDVLLRGLRAHP